MANIPSWTVFWALWKSWPGRLSALSRCFRPASTQVHRPEPDLDPARPQAVEVVEQGLGGRPGLARGVRQRVVGGVVRVVAQFDPHAGPRKDVSGW